MGPEGSVAHDVYLRTAVSVDPKGWAHFEYVKMPDYRWGIFLTPQEENKVIGFGAHKGQPVWNEVPGEYRSTLRRIIVTQGDTEPASVEQQRQLGAICPSLYDLRNLYQVNVEEGRHLWAMVYLLHAHFGRDGREEGEACSSAARATPTSRASWAPSTRRRPTGCRSSSSRSSPIATASTSSRRWPSRASTRWRARPSSCSPRRRTTCSWARAASHASSAHRRGHAQARHRRARQGARARRHRPAHAAALPELPLQRDARPLRLRGLVERVELLLVGPEGALRRVEARRRSRAHERRPYVVPVVAGDRIETRAEHALLTLNERLRDDYIVDCQAGRRSLEQAPREGRPARPPAPAAQGLPPQDRGVLRGEGEPRRARAHRGRVDHQHHAWLPSESDRAFVRSLMGRVAEPGRYAHWIAPPPRGIDNRPADFEYVRFG
jgi:benzoyl-CoA 2,3-dioxygenase component B